MRIIPGMITMAGGVFVIVVAWLGRVGKVPRNDWVGLRLPSTKRSDAAWMAAQRSSWIYTALAGLALVLWAGWLLVDDDAVYVLPLLVIGMLPLLILGGFRGRAAAKKAYEQETRHG